MKQQSGPLLYEVPRYPQSLDPQHLYSLPQSAAPSPVMHFRLQIQLQPQHSSAQPAPPSNNPPSQPQQPQPAPLQPEQPTLSQVIQLLQLVQQLRTPVPTAQPVPPQLYQHPPTHPNHPHRRSAHHVYRFQPYAPPQPHPHQACAQPRATPPVPDREPRVVSPLPDPESRASSPIPDAEPLSPPSPCSVDDEPESRSTPKRTRTDYTHEFRERFAAILQNSEPARNAWRDFRNQRTACTIARAPCIKTFREFCEEFGGDLQALSAEEKYEKLGSITKCGCSSS